MTYSEIHIWGDSVARGILYNENKKRYAISQVRFTSILENALPVKTQNHAIMGMTVEEGLAAFSQSVPIPGALCAIEFGGNDCDLDWAYVAQHPTEPILAKVPLPRYREALKSFVKLARERDMHPLLVTPPPLHAPRYFQWVTRDLDADAVLSALKNDVHSIYRWQERYAIAMRNVAVETECRLLDMRDVFLSQLAYGDLMCADGIHPNEAGHQLIAEAALKAALLNPHMPPAKGAAEPLQVS